MERTVAVFRIGQLGDTVVALPAISLIRKIHPTSQFVLITDRHAGKGFVSAWDLLGSTKWFSDVLFYDASASTLQRIINSILLATQLRRLKTGVLYYLAPFPRTQQQVKRDTLFFRSVCGIQEIHGLEATQELLRQRGSDGLLAHIPSETDRLLSIVQRATSTVRTSHKVSFMLPTGEKERATVNRYWKEADLSGCKGPIIGIGPGSKMPVKRWSSDRFIEVVNTLLKNIPEARFIVLGGPEDEELGIRISLAAGGAALSWAGKLTVLESAEVLTRCTLFLGNDTGLMHLAAAMGTKCVAVFSARDNPGKWYPLGNGHVVFRKSVPCEGCLLVECHDNDMACLKAISSDEVCTACLVSLGSETKTAPSL